MAKFYEALHPTVREQYVDVFLEIQTQNQFNWRIREVISQQMDVLSVIFSDDTTFRIILPICFSLCRDDISIVRKTASKNIYQLFMKMYNSGNPLYKMTVVENIKAFAVLPKYSYRQVFLSMIEPLIQHMEIFEENFIDEFIEIGNDKTPNVRISLA